MIEMRFAQTQNHGPIMIGEEHIGGWYYRGNNPGDNTPYSMRLTSGETAECTNMVQLEAVVKAMRENR